MTTDNRASWRNFLVWGAVGAAVYVAAVVTITAFRPEGALATIARSEAVIAKLALLGLLSAGMIGLSMRKRPINLRNLRNHLAMSIMAIVVSLLALQGVRSALGGASLGTSATIALVLGGIVVVFTAFGLVLVAAAHARVPILTAEQAETVREGGRMMAYSWLSIGCMGLALAVLALAGPSGPLVPVAGLSGALVLLALTAIFSRMAWQLMDELMRTLSRESGNIGFSLILILGGVWAILAHGGVAPSPAPLDWLTLFTAITFIASIVATSRRGLLDR